MAGHVRQILPEFRGLQSNLMRRRTSAWSGLAGVVFIRSCVAERLKGNVRRNLLGRVVSNPQTRHAKTYYICNFSYRHLHKRCARFDCLVSGVSTASITLHACSESRSVRPEANHDRGVRLSYLLTNF